MKKKLITLKKKKIIVYLLAIVALILLGVGIKAVVGVYKMNQIPSMSFEEMLQYTTKHNNDAIITVGIIKDGKMNYTVYGENGTVLPQKEYTYEIGSVTKTFTCSLLCKAIADGKVTLSDSIGKYMDLPKENYYPSYKRLVTHTSGYKEYYFDWQMAYNFFNRQENDFYGISTKTLNKQISEQNVDDKTYQFKYSNFGISAVGSALAKIYGNSYKTIMNDFISSELQLEHTRISDAKGEFQGYWNWKHDDGYIPAGGIVSTIGDMMKYVDLHMREEIPYLAVGHNEIANVNATSKQYEKIGIRIDSVGIGWMIDTQNGIIWHNGGTSNFNSYISFDKENQIGVVVLSNLSPNYRIPATVMGVKLMQSLKNEIILD